MPRPQKTAKVGCPCEGMLETESNKGACSVAQLETERQDGAENLLEAILDRNNLNKAYAEGTSLPNKAKSNTARTLRCKCGRYMRGRLLLLTGEVLQWGEGQID